MAVLSKKDKTGILIIIICAIIFIGIGVIAIIVNNNKIELDENTLCLIKKPPSGHTAILVDRTDPLSQNQSKWLFILVNKIKANLPVYGKLSIIPITKESGKFLNPIFSLCSPRKGNKANPFYENPRKLKNFFDLQFGKPLQKVLNNLSKGETYSESPIIESIQRLTQTETFSTIPENRKIIIISDMLQNTRSINHYKKYSADSFVESKYFNEIKPELNNTDVIVYYLASNIPKTLKYQGEIHKEFWKKFFMKSNAANFKLIPISNLDLEESATLSEEIARIKLNAGETLVKHDPLVGVNTLSREDNEFIQTVEDGQVRDILKSLIRLGEINDPNLSATRKKGPSFNCILAKTWDEKAICSNQELASLDLGVNKIYHASLIKLKNSDQQKTFVNSQLDWLKFRHLCHIEENKTGCLKDRMSSRIEFIKEFNTVSRSKYNSNSSINPSAYDEAIKKFDTLAKRINDSKYENRASEASLKVAEDEDFKLFFKVKVSSANLRDKPNTKTSKIIFVLSKGTPVEVLGKKGNWSKIRSNPRSGEESQTGWLASKLLDSEIK
jgi:uncharacterized protein